MIGMIDLAWRHGQDDAETRVLEVLRSGHWLGGPVVAEAEAEIARQFERPCAVGVGSGTDALILGLQALGVHAGARVGVPALTFFATAGAVCAIGATPVVLDVDERGLLADVPDGLDAVIPVHLFGNCARIETAVPVLEDAAQSIGTSMGGLIAVSTYPTKVLSGAGNGGFVVGEREAVERVRALGSHGLIDGVHVPIAGHVGRNSRLGAVEAAVVLAQLGSLRARVARRRQIAAHYDELLGGRALRRDADNIVPVYCLRHADRAGLRAALNEAGISSTVYYPRPLHLQPALAEHITATHAPTAELLCDELLAIPVHAGLTDTHVERVSAVLGLWI